LDALCYWFVKCPVRGRGTLYRVESRAGFDENDRVEMVGVLDEGATADFLKYLRRGNPLPL
jgi:hypothetical protein